AITTRLIGTRTVQEPPVSPIPGPTGLSREDICNPSDSSCSRAVSVLTIDRRTISATGKGAPKHNNEEKGGKGKGTEKNEGGNDKHSSKDRKGGYGGKGGDLNEKRKKKPNHSHARIKDGKGEQPDLARDYILWDTIKQY